MTRLPPPGEVKLPRVHKGRRPSFFEDPAIDQVMTFVLELVTEVAVLRERLDSVERLLDSNTSISRDDIEGYRADPDVAEARAAWREAYLNRVLRMHPGIGK